MSITPGLPPQARDERTVKFFSPSPVLIWWN